MLVALGFITIVSEPLSHRLLSLAVLGVVPAFTTWATGWVMCRLLRVATIICDYVAALYARAFLTQE